MDAFEAVCDLKFAVAPGERICVLGPSGCGKSTLFGALAGHLQPPQGRLIVDGEPPRARKKLFLKWGRGRPWGQAAPSRAVRRPKQLAICATCSHARRVWTGRNKTHELSLMPVGKVKSGTGAGGEPRRDLERRRGICLGIKTL